MPNKEICKRCGKIRYSMSLSGLCKDCLTISKREQKLKTWLETGDTGYSTNSTIRGIIRDYILSSQGNCCAICGIPNIWNNLELTFILDHIDGDASNGDRSNLRLICPNCDSQLDTYKSRNHNSARGNSIKDSRLKPVAKIDINTLEVLEEFESIEAAAKNLGCSSGSLRACLSGRSNTCCGFYWKFLEND